MSYYQGDYYQGDYYQGDPFLGSLFKMGKWAFKGIRGIVRKVRGRAPGQQWGGGTSMVPSDRGMMVRRAVGQVAKTGAGAVGTGMAFGIGQSLMMPPEQTMFGGPSSYAQPGRGFVGPPAPAQVAGGGMCCPSGYHLAKDGTGRCVRNRSMNVANPRALRRSLRRVAGFGKLAQRSKRDIRRAAKAIGA